MAVDLTGGAGEELLFDEDGIATRRSVLPGGIRVLTDYVPGQKSVAAAFWVGAGSRDEASGAEGSTHFLEHLLFKGTQTRSAVDISTLGDFLGGSLNAATSRQFTEYYGHVFSGDLPQLLELLVDMFVHSTLDREAMELERGVIIEELAASDDDVSECAENAIMGLVMGDHPLARPVGGTIETVRALQHDHMMQHYRKNYRSEELVVTAAGDVNHNELCQILCALLDSAGWNLSDGQLPQPRRRVADVQYTSGCRRFIAKPGRQSAVVVGVPGLQVTDSRITTLNMLETILGGGQSSRLFQEVREKKGLAYATFAWSSAYPEGGVFAMESQCAPENTGEVRRIMTQCLHDIAEHGVSEHEVETAFRQYRAQVVFSAEAHSFRRNRLGQAELIRGQLRTISELLDEARAVTAADIRQLAEDLAQRPQSVAVAGPEEARS
ncbi:M16 family metallopeptidase [Trueperella sp. LYQ143]|uniref:M16 family metallopeptidase n=1 Tax=unclassified Trueperella TaxID=2630174 RepID=UPI0039830028